MRNYWTVLGLIIIVCAGGFIMGYNSKRFRSYPESLSMNGFDMKTPMIPKARMMAAAPSGPMPLRDAVGLAPGADPRRAPSPAPLGKALTPGASRAYRQEAVLPKEKAPAAWVSKNRMFQALVSSPVDFMVRRTHLGKAERLEGFLKDPRRVKRYLEHPLIGAVLDHPVLLKSLLGRPSVVKGFLTSPAMQDRHAVSALASSLLLREIMKRPGVRAVLEDPAFVQKVLMDPRTAAWLSRNPQALSALGQLGPALAKALAPASLSGR